MSACSPEALEAYADGDLDHDAAADVAAHLPTCRACVEELHALRAERRLFAARAAAHPPPPAFEEVLARVLESARAVDASPPRTPDASPAAVRFAARSRRMAVRGRAAASPWPPRAAAIALALATLMIVTWRGSGPSFAPDPVGSAPRAEWPPPVAELPRAVASAPDPTLAPKSCFICQPSDSGRGDTEPEYCDRSCGEVDQDCASNPGSGNLREENVTCSSSGPHGE